MSTPNYSSEFFSAVGKIIESLPSNLTEDELKAVGPDLESFLTWVQQNPSAVLNPVVSGPKLLVLKAQVMAAQSTVASELIASAAGEMNSTLKMIMSQLSGSTPTTASTAKP